MATMNALGQPYNAWQTGIFDVMADPAVFCMGFLCGPFQYCSVMGQ
jgi:hypothetical protein